MDGNDKPKSFFRIALTGVLRAPPRMKLALLINVALITTIAANEIADYVRDDSPTSSARIAAILLVFAGGFLLSIASVLWSISQFGEDCQVLTFNRAALHMRVRKLDEMLIIFPVLAFVAGVCVAVGLGIYGSMVTNSTWAGAVIGFGVGFFLWTAAMISTTTRFLYTHAREQAEAAERARSEATEAQLEALQSQMNPHFLFNALNTVASLVRTDSAAAEATVENLSVVLRRTLDRSKRTLSTVDDEIDYLAAYLSVAKQRFGDRVHVEWAVDPEARKLVLPTMTLQPLVENALQHGVGARLEGGVLRIGARVEGNWVLVIEVADDGPGFPRGFREGTGLANLRERLSTLYGADARLEVDRSVPGSRVVISLPAVETPDEVMVTALNRGAEESESDVSEDRPGDRSELEYGLQLRGSDD